jgi:hypothetical protein
MHSRCSVSQSSDLRSVLTFDDTQERASTRRAFFPRAIRRRGTWLRHVLNEEQLRV